MKRIFIYSLLLILFLLFFLYLSCSTDPECISNISFTIVDSNYNNLVDTNGNKYRLDSIKLFDQKGAPVTPLHFGHTTDSYKGKSIGLVFSIGLLEGKSRNDSENFKFDRKYFLQFCKNNIDTIQIIGLENWCNRVTVKYNSKLYEKQETYFYLFIKK
jgi:hypothetical protein